MSIDNLEVLNLFPSRVAVFTVTEDLTNLEQIKNHKFGLAQHDGNHNLYRTFSLDLLKSFPEEEKLILDYFNKFKNTVLGFNNIDFFIQKSWAIKAEENGRSQGHIHSDAYYVGVLYFDNISEGGELEFTSEGLRPFKLSEFPTVGNNPAFANEKYTFKPRKNILVFFPGYLKHFIMPNLSTSNRYSIAFNLLPL